MKFLSILTFFFISIQSQAYEQCNRELKAAGHIFSRSILENRGIIDAIMIRHLPQTIPPEYKAVMKEKLANIKNDCSIFLTKYAPYKCYEGEVLANSATVHAACNNVEENLVGLWCKFYGGFSIYQCLAD